MNLIDRLKELIKDTLEETHESFKQNIDEFIEWNNPFNFRGVYLYGYESDEGITEEVKQWLEDNLSHPEYCEILNTDRF